MQKSTALEIIRTFTSDDSARFEDFIKSPYFNKNSNVIRLFILVKKYSPEYNSQELEKEKLWGKLFPDKPFNYGTMKNLIFELKKLTAKYITVHELESNKLEEEKILVRALGIRNIPRFFISKVHEIEKKYRFEKLTNLKIETEDYLAFMFLIKYMKHAYLRVYDSKLARNEDLQAYTTLMICSFIRSATSFYNNIIVQSLEINFKPEKNALLSFVNILKEGAMDEILKAVNEYSTPAGKYVKLCWLRVKAIMKDAVAEDFYEFRNAVYNEAGTLPALELKGFLSGVVNAANMLNSPEINVSKERVDSLKLRMRRKILTHDDGRIYALELLQYFWSAGNINDFAIIEKLCKDYVAKSNDINKDNVLKCGEIFFKIRDEKYNQALELISIVTPETFMMKVHLRMLKVRCFFKTGDYESFLYERDSLNHFLKSNKSLSEKNINQLKDFFEKVNRLFRLKRNFDDIEFKILREELLSNKNYPVWMRDEV